MSFESDFATYVEEAVRDADIQSAIAASSRDGITEEYVRNRLIELKESITSDAAPLIAEMDDLERGTALKRHATHSQLNTFPWWASFSALLTSLGIVFALVLVIGSVLGFGLLAALETQARANHVYLVAYVMLLTLMLLAVTATVYYFGFAIRRKSDISDAQEAELDAQLHAYQASFRTHFTLTIVEQAREIINDATSSFFQERLFVGIATRRPPNNLRSTNGAGLSQVRNALNEVPTAAREKVLRLFEKLPGGSIGIAGPRGVGKSTLLASVCKRKFSIRGRDVVAVLTSAPVQYDAREFLLHLYAATCDAALLALDTPSSLDGPRETLFALFPARLASQSGRRLAFGAFVATALISAICYTLQHYLRSVLLLHVAQWTVWLALLTLIQSLALTIFMLERNQKERRREEQLSPIVSKAKKALLDIRFQQSYSSGWSGTLKALPGLEAGLQQAAAFAQLQKTLPELVTEYRAFLELLSENYAVVVGIDELDKLESDEKAQEFLNEIKSVFNVSNCFYLVAISESAINAFERRGLPFRDAFDSAFDDVEYVGLLSLSESRTLLARRVLFLPQPFLFLAHALAAGLPRDLIRIARRMLDIASEDDSGMPLAKVAERLCNDEVGNKLRAAMFTARKSHLYNEKNDFMRWCTGLLSLNAASVEFESQSKQNPLHALARRTPVLAVSDSERAAQVDLQALHAETAAFLSYCAEVRARFVTINATNVNDDEVVKSIEDIANARQSFELGPLVVLDLLSRAEARRKGTSLAAAVLTRGAAT